MAYCDVDELKEYLDISGETDDELLASLIAASQKLINSHCGRVFEAASDSTRYFDSSRDVSGSMLIFDGDICVITSITNGDGTSVTVSHYVTEPRNQTPYYAVRLKTSSNKSWVDSISGDSENAITVVGRWAYSIAAPDDIVHACKRLAGYIYRQKDNAGDLDRAVIAGNSTLLPAQIPSDIKMILQPYKRVTK